jgi:hypothetical protein
MQMATRRPIATRFARGDFFFAAALVACCAAGGGSHAEEKPLAIETLPPAATRHVDFAADVQPLFAQHCYECHGAETQEAGLRLDVRKKALAGADNGPVIVPKQSTGSRLIHLVAGLDAEVGRMPPEVAGEPLTPEQIGLLRAWIDQGAEWPDSASGEDGPALGAEHWSFQPIARPNPPSVQNESWVRNDIDRFVLAKLEQEKVAPSAEADRNALLRRAYLDLIGLPPTPAEIEAFLADTNSDVFERAVDRLLESPHYGERWGRHWLDAVHYADSDGYEKDRGRPFAWRYRDWVINAINADMPYNVFTVQQLAGDLLTSADPEYDPAAHIATGYLRNTLINTEGGIDPEEDRVKRTIDRTNTLGAIWLGLTVGCANCHSHKYDPINQREYFGLYAFFNSLREVDPPVSPVTTDKVADASSTSQTKAADESVAAAGSNKPAPAAPADQQLFQAVAEEEKPRDTYMHLRGDFLSKGPLVEPQTPEVLPPLHVRGARPDRLDIARWLVSDEHPLTARVVVNRMWQQFFGRGLVSTADDFGTQGERPSHADLLDWLANEFRSSGWRMKYLHRLIVTSATYRQSAAARPELVDRDPYNTLLSRQNRLRVEAELVRDAALAASGLLNPAIGGPSVRPPQPAGISDLTYANSAQWTESTGPERYRRGLYIWFQRTSPYPLLVGFDAPESILACTRRERSNTPLQALTLLNDVVFVECAQRLGQRMMAATTNVADPKLAADERIQYAFEVAISRRPTAEELTTLRQLYDESLEQFRADQALARKLTGDSPPADAQADDAAANQRIIETATCIAVARAVINLDEFITRE